MAVFFKQPIIILSYYFARFTMFLIDRDLPCKYLRFKTNVKFKFYQMKNTKALALPLFMALLFILFSSYVKAQETQVKVTGIRSGKGKIILNVFRNNETYDNQQPCKVFTFDKKELANGSLVVTCRLEPGIYGITLVDDENGNGKIDKNFIGTPKEGFGFSNFFMEKMKKPVFDDFKVDLKSPNNNIVIRVKYM